ncbi:hypothetical protein T265_07884 [Opisthorchis viverrini]|uniref:DUF7083 domain-containing protein n=1 Tax=Opisthorchis viverrini TaxID=6198 RepID=A0A075AA63_OPIVI|nr:hypothetical protein T265_07884 [Opisthorchis viverrini]KER24459.1 hypothetical protein T265_07884 [Opisthorchis viverrini]
MRSNASRLEASSFKALAQTRVTDECRWTKSAVYSYRAFCYTIVGGAGSQGTDTELHYRPARYNNWRQPEPTMSISAEQLQLILQQQQKQFEEAQLRLVESLMRSMSVNAIKKGEPPSSSADAAASSITEFNFDAESGRTFESWFKKYEDMFQTDFAQFDDAWKRMAERENSANQRAFWNAEYMFNQRNRLFNQRRHFTEQTSHFRTNQQMCNNRLNEIERLTLSNLDHCVFEVDMNSALSSCELCSFVWVPIVEPGDRTSRIPSHPLVIRVS